MEKNIKRNEKFINEFEEWLIDKQLTDRTIRKHLVNIDLYLNYYLNYYDIIKMEDGVSKTYMFFSDWFIRKYLGVSKNSIKEHAASVKKFYQCMSEKGYVRVDEYKMMCMSINDGMDGFLKSLDRFDIYDDDMNWVKFL